MVSVTGGGKLGKVLADMASSVGNASSVKVGFLENATYPNTGTQVALVAAIQEFGAPGRGIPPRPFFRPMIQAKSPEWPKAIAEDLKRTNYNAAATLDALGDQVAGQLKDSIVATDSPALSPVTLMLRGMRSQSKYDGKRFGELIAIARQRVSEGKSNYGASTKPLEDTRTMLHAVSHVVE